MSLPSPNTNPFNDFLFLLIGEAEQMQQEAWEIKFTRNGMIRRCSFQMSEISAQTN